MIEFIPRLFGWEVILVRSRKRTYISICAKEETLLRVSHYIMHQVYEAQACETEAVSALHDSLRALSKALEPVK